MEDSFTLQLEPINSIRSEKQYIQEIENLRSENFGLKTENAQLKMNPLNSNIEFEKTLIETKTIIENLQNQKVILLNRVNELESILTNKETNKIEGNELSIKIRNENIDLSEENTRLIKHIENLNIKIDKLEKEIFISKSIFNKREFEIKREFDVFESKNKELKILKDEVYSLRSDNKKYMQSLNDLNISLETQNQKIYNLEKKLHEKMAENENLKIIYEKEKEIWKNDIKERNKIIDSNKNLYIEKMNEKLNEIIELKTNSNIKINGNLENALKSLNQPSNINKSNITNILSNLIKIISQYKRKSDNLENESKVMNEITERRSKFLNKETLELLEEFGKEFSGARTELNECQRYLEKKGTEIKELKRELFRLKRVA